MKNTNFSFLVSCKCKSVTKRIFGVTSTLPLLKTLASSLLLFLFATNVWGEEQSFAFSTIGSTGWVNSYADHYVTIGSPAVATVSMNASKQTGTITDFPVTKGKPVSLVLSDNTKSISDVSFTCRQWSDKTQTITLKYSTDGGSSYSTLSPSVTSTNFSISSSSLPTGTNAVQITFSSQANQVGIESVSFTIASDDCTDPTTLLSISSANSAVVGTPLTLTTDGGNGSTVTWSIVSGGSYASLSGSTLTPTAAGTVCVQASQSTSDGKCGKTVTQDITISVAPIDVTLYYKGTSASLTNQANPYTLPKTGTFVENACDEWTFDGWYGSSYAKNTTKPTYITQLTATGNAYAVYKHTESGGVSGNWVASEQGWSNETAATTKSAGDITVSWDKGSNNNSNAPKYYTSGTAVRAYGGNTFTVSSTGGNMSSITIGFGTSDGSNGITATPGSYSDGSWSGDASSVTFTIGGTSGNRRIASITATGGTTYYSTDAECGPKVQATASPWVTSTNGQFVKVEVPVTATNFDKNSTLSASVSGTGFSIVGWGANGNSVAKDVDLTTSLILAYNPSAYNTTADATITFSSNYSGSQTPVYTNGTVHGRSLPEKFVIAINNGDQWYALPANMSGSGTYAAVEVDVDNVANPTIVNAGPANALYSLLNVYKTSGADDRYADYGTRVRLLGVEKCLWSNAANGGTGINNGAAPVSATSDNYEWTLVTDDGVTYAINTNVAKKISENRELSYNAGDSRFGMYTAGNSSFRFLPVSCTTRATVTSVTPTYDGASLEWVGDGSASYTLYIKQSSTTKKTITASTSPVVVTGLDSETEYTWILSPGDDDDDCAISSTFTTNVAPINVTLSCDGSTYDLGPQNKPFTLPVAGEQYAEDACTEWTFEGWTDGTYAKNSTKPTLLTQVNASGTYYAVYKYTDGGGGSSTNYTLTIETGDFASDGYSAKLNDIDAVDDGDNTNTMSVSFSKSNAGRVGSNIQFKSGGYIYNTTDLGTITSISTNSSYVSYYVNSSANPSSSGSGGYFKLYGTSVTATNNVTSSIDIHFTIGSGSTTYYSTSSECCNEVTPPAVSVDAVDVSATISWDSQSGATNGYHVTCSNGTDSDVAAGTTSLEIAGLTPTTEYTYMVIAKGATCNRSTTGSFTTASCSEVPRNISISPTTNSATVYWTSVTSTAKIKIYSDDNGTDVVKTEDNLTSGSTVTGLAEGTTYYLRVFAAETCYSNLIEFSTLSTAVSVAEWFPDSIRINLTADEATASVLLEDKQTSSVVTTSYADGLFFSKYYEAYRNVKLWAIFNGTKEKISLTDVVVKVSSNGAAWGTPTSLATYGHTEAGYIYPGEEIIVYNDGNDTQDGEIMACMEEAYGDAYKNNPDSLWYHVDNNATRFSGDDGLILLKGTDTLDVIGGLHFSTAHSKVKNSSWGDNSGWVCADGVDEEGNKIGISTNRCLLVRKNSVKSGLDAVDKNKDDFVTLCDEWWGAHVPVSSGGEVQTSCDNFSYVGHYDYNAYYAKFDSLTMVDELTGKQNPDGTYTIPIPELDTLSCSMLRVKVYESGVEKASVEYKVPIMVEGSKATTADIFKNEKHDEEACKQCDVVVLKGATLTKAADGTTNDVAQVRNISVYPGGTLDIPTGRTYNVSSILLRVEGENVPHTKLKGTLNTTDQKVIVTRRINNDRYYFFSLPYDCNIADIRWASGEIPVRGTDYQIVEYDSERRAEEGSTKGAPGHWKPVEGTQLKAGVGYNIAVSSKALKELVFPMSIGSTDLTNVEDTKTSNKVTIGQHTGSTTINNHNWNLIAHPYISDFNAYSDAKIKAGWLKCTIDEENFTVDWSLEETDKVYLTVPSFNAGKITYSQTVSTNITSLDPFLAVFVQGAGAGDLIFDQSNRKLTAPSRHWAAASEYEDQSIFVGVTLRGNGQTDQANVRIRPDFTDDYQLGYDLLKFTTFYTERPQVYMKTAAHQLAFQAVSDSVAKKTFLPVGVYCYTAGKYTFALSEDYPLDEVEAVYLYDAVTGITTNLLYDTYTITTTKQLYTNTRFSLNVIVNRRSPQITTDIETGEAPENAVRKFLINGHICIQQGDKLYDVTGKNLLNR